MSINNDFCCERMMFATEDIDCPLKYISETRYYKITAPAYFLKKKKKWPSYEIENCPFCGTKLPKDLVDERFEILEKEYGITDPYDAKQKQRIPAEFMTAEWWKKRGL